MSQSVSWRLVVTAVAVALGGSFQFFSFAVINPCQSVIRDWINDTYASRDGAVLGPSTLTLILSVTVSATLLGACLGSIATRRLADGLGRRKGLLVNGLITIFAGIMTGFSKTANSPELLIFGRLLFGVNLGLASGLVPLYLTEAAPVRYRGALGTVHQLSVAFADSISLVIGLPEVLGNKELWPLAFSLPAITAALMCMVLPFCAESPRFLMITKKDGPKAERALTFFIAPDALTDETKTLREESLRAAVYERRRENITVASFLTLRELRTPLLICILLMVAQQFTGVVPVFAYSTQMFQQAGLSDQAARLSTVGIGVAYFLSTIPAIYLIERAGRRALSIFSLAGDLICTTLLIIFTAVRDSQPQLSWPPYLSIGALAAFMIIYGIGSPVPWMIPSEVFTQDYRSYGVSVATFVVFLLAFILNTAYLPFQEAVGISFSFLPFALVTFIALVLVCLFLPETRNKTIDEIVRNFRKRRATISRAFLHGDFSGRRASRMFSETEPLLRAKTTATSTTGLPYDTFYNSRGSMTTHSVGLRADLK